MSFSYWLTAAAVAFLPLAAPAQQTQQQLDPSDGASANAVPAYVSPFEGYIRVSADNTSPDKVWRTANDQVRTQGSHGGHAMQSGLENTQAKPVPGSNKNGPAQGNETPSKAAPTNRGEHQHGGH